MTKLDRAERRSHRAWFESWRTPAEMETRSNELKGHMGTVDLFNQGGVDFITEAYAAAQIAACLSAEAVTLVPERERWPDFQLRMGGRVQAWEFTEADLPDRRRGQEFRENAARIAEGGSFFEDDPFEHWVERAAQVPEALRRAVAVKLERHYSTKVPLLIYLNINEFDIRQTEIEAALQSETEAGKNAFTEIWVLWKETAYQVWADGNPASQRRLPPQSSAD